MSCYMKLDIVTLIKPGKDAVFCIISTGVCKMYIFKVLKGYAFNEQIIRLNIPVENIQRSYLKGKQ